MGAPGNKLGSPGHCRRAIGWRGRRGLPVVSARPLQVRFPRPAGVPQRSAGPVQLSPGYRALDVETARPRRMGGLGFATQRRAPHCGWQSVRIARAFWSDTQLVCRDVDGEIPESMADDALSNLRAVESQMETGRGGHWEELRTTMSGGAGMTMSRLDPADECTLAGASIAVASD